MQSHQKSLFRLFLLPSALSTSFRKSCKAFLSVATPRRTTSQQRWAATHSSDFTATNAADSCKLWDGISNVLVCGDGDLSYSAWLAEQLAEAGVSLTATVLETEEVHNSVYKNSQQHADRISSFVGHQVCFGIDATQLPTYFANATFDRILFNFPHWRGKANNRRNRELLRAFLGSANQVLNHDKGQVQVAFCEGQGGATASTNKEWKQSWFAPLYAAEHGLLLVDVEPYVPAYDLSSHRGVDRPFRTGRSPALYNFMFPTGEPVDRSIQLCCRHELHLILPENETEGVFTKEGIIRGDEVLEFVRTLVPSGIRVEIPIRQVLSSSETSSAPDMIVFLIVYCGERKQLTRSEADSYRNTLETEISKYLELRENRRCRLVSRPFPYQLLQELIDNHITNAIIKYARSNLVPFGAE